MKSRYDDLGLIRSPELRTELLSTWPIQRNRY
jgi:hypothetical protein